MEQTTIIEIKQNKLIEKIYVDNEDLIDFVVMVDLINDI